MSEAPTTSLDPELLERLRRGVPLRVTATGDLWLGDGPITHRGVRRALREGLDVTEQGEPTARIGNHWCYVHVDDCLFRATAAFLDTDSIRLRLDDHRIVELDPASLWEEPGRGLRCTAPCRYSGRLAPVRFTNRAQMDLSPALEPTGDGTCLTLGSQRAPIGNRDPTLR